MTDKPYTPRPVRLSKAPPPIGPISTKQNILPDLPPAGSPNWGKWAYMRDIELWEAVALSLNLEPDKLPVYLGAYEKLGDDPFRICPTPFLERLLVANSNCGISLGFKPVHELKARCLVDLPEFAAWAVKLNIPNLPPELLAMADTKAAQNLMPEPQAAPVVTETTEQRRARWLDWYGKGERGAVQRVYERELLLNPKADRSFIGKEIDKAKMEKAEIKRGGAMFGQLVQDGKRKS